MSDNIPFEIQMEILKKVSDVKSLIQFRSVSNPWKSFIDSHEFIKGYGTRDTQPHTRMLPLSPGSYDDLRYICLVDDDIETFKVCEQESKFAASLVSPLLNQYCVSYVVGACHGLLCLYGSHRGYEKRMVVIWNPSIQKAFGIVVPNSACRSYNKYDYGLAFGVCPVTSDPTVVKISHGIDKPRHGEVFTLSSGVWNVIPCGKLPRESVNLNTYTATPVVIDGFIYWGAWELMRADDGETTRKHMVVSFDLITKEFKVVDLPDALSKKLWIHVSVSKLRECLVVYGAIKVEGATCCGVWVMEQDTSFRKLFTIATRVDKILGFRKSGEALFETQKGERRLTTLNLYDPSSQKIKNLGISGEYGSFFMGFDKESLLLLDHADSHIYSDDS